MGIDIMVHWHHSMAAHVPVYLCVMNTQLGKLAVAAIKVVNFHREAPILRSSFYAVLVR